LDCHDLHMAADIPALGAARMSDVRTLTPAEREILTRRQRDMQAAYSALQDVMALLTQGGTLVLDERTGTLRRADAV
jgi:hypothetical protein